MDKYWTSVVKGIGEFQQIATAENPEIDELKGCLTRLLNDSFVKDATEYGVKRWESILNIIPGVDDTLDDRKVKILSLLNMTLPYTYKMLEGVVESILGADNYKMYIRGYTLTLEADFKSDNEYHDILNLFDNVVPKNLIVVMKPLSTDYVEFDGTFYFDTGLVGNQDIAYEIEVCRLPGTTGHNGLFGCFSGDIWTSCTIGNITNRFAGTRTHKIDSVKSYVRYKIYNGKDKSTIKNCETGQVFVDETEVLGEFTSTESLPLGGINMYSVMRGFWGRIYGCKIWQAGKLVRNFIPTMKNGVSCFYDLVENKFYGRVEL